MSWPFSSLFLFSPYPSFPFFSFSQRPLSLSLDFYWTVEAVDISVPATWILEVSSAYFLTFFGLSLCFPFIFISCFTLLNYSFSHIHFSPGVEASGILQACCSICGDNELLDTSCVNLCVGSSVKSIGAYGRLVLCPDRQYGHPVMPCIRKWKACISLWRSVQWC